MPPCLIDKIVFQDIIVSLGIRWNDGKDVGRSPTIIGCGNPKLGCPENPKNEAPNFNQVLYKDCNKNTYRKSHEYVEEFARDQAAWTKAFGDVYEKMLGET